MGTSTRKDSFNALKECMELCNEQVKFMTTTRPRFLCKQAKKKYYRNQCEILDLQVVMADKLKRHGEI